MAVACNDEVGKCSYIVVSIYICLYIIERKGEALCGEKNRVFLYKKEWGIIGEKKFLTFFSKNY